MGIVGTVRSAPALAALLAGEERTSHAARYALESMPCPEADTVLIEALAKTSGLVKAGIINSLGTRRDRTAVPTLIKLLSDPDIQVVASAITALGRIAGPEVLAVLNMVKIDSSLVLQTPLNEAFLMCAEALVSSGDKKTAYEIYEKIYESKAPQYFRVAAYRGLILTSDEKKALKLVEKGLKGKERSSLTASLQMAGELKGENATKALSKLLPKLSPEIQCRFIDALVQHDGSSVLEALLSIADSRNPDVRIAVLKAMSRVGNDSAVPLLLKSLASSKNVEQESAREALIRLQDKNSTKLIAENLSKIEGLTKLEVIRILGLRRDVSAIPILLKLAEDTDESIRITSIQSLAMLANEASSGDLVTLLLRAKTESQRSEIEKALALAGTRSTNKDQCAAPVVAALAGTDVTGKCALLRVCGNLTGSTALNALREGIKNNDAEVQGTAIRSLASSHNPEAIPDQLAYAKNTANQTYRVLLLRGCMKMIDEDVNIPAGRKIEICKDVMSVSDRFEEKMLVVSCLSKLNTIESLKVLETFLSDNSLKKDAATAILKIGKSFDASQTDAVKSVLQKANEVMNASRNKTGN
ncbi:MAG: HEAT repeat domain-containing protein [Kiritimatiellae bacterium]|nr:HEAT repeat domain-containing protein [Kiritimatiellia bacterium]MDD5522012.1 HEAT repeat domain-containing protein [Kiritimatiellia bacterium]